MLLNGDYVSDLQVATTMKGKFEISYRRSRGNLHLYLKGDFDGICAWELMKTIKRQYNGTGRVFVSTDNIGEVLQRGVQLFKEHMGPKIMPVDKLFLKGEKGLKIGPSGCRVLLIKRPCARHRFKERLNRPYCRTKGAGRKGDTDKATALASKICCDTKPGSKSGGLVL